jgi:uncharacterized protein (DUF1330 family)
MPQNPNVPDGSPAEPLNGSFGGLNPTEEQVHAIMNGPDGAVQMINLLKFRERAQYPSDYTGEGATDVSGEDAYGRYGSHALAQVVKRGGRLVLLSAADEAVIGAPGEWDQVAIMEYPTRRAFLDMARDPDYLSAIVHRTAGLERTAVLATTPLFEEPRPG